MWDQLIVCYRLLDKKQAAQELVLTRLQVWRYCVCADSWLGMCPEHTLGSCLAHHTASHIDGR